MQINDITLNLVALLDQKEELEDRLKAVDSDIGAIRRTVRSIKEQEAARIRNAQEAQAALEKSRQNSE